MKLREPKEEYIPNKRENRYPTSKTLYLLDLEINRLLGTLRRVLQWRDRAAARLEWVET